MAGRKKKLVDTYAQAVNIDAQPKNIMFTMRRKRKQVAEQTEAGRIVKRYKRLKVNPKKEWPAVYRMLYKAAWRVSQVYYIPFETARSEVEYAFMKACWRFTGDRGAEFSTLCMFLANCRLRRLVMNRCEDSRLMPTVPINEEILVFAPEQRSELLEMVAGLSEDAQEIVSLLVETPKELVGMALTPRQFMKKVKMYLMRKGRTRKELDRAQRELRNAFFPPPPPETWLTRFEAKLGFPVSSIRIAA